MSRFEDTVDPSWRAKSADYLRGEFLEVMDQHGPGLLMMLPDGLPLPLPEDEAEPLAYKMADEIGDSLWFCFDIADKARINMPAAAMQVIRKIDAQSVDPTATFEHIEAAATKHASEIKVITKSGLLFGDDLSEEHRYRSLEQNPSYLYVRTLNRLIKALDQSVAPMPSATDLEPAEALPDALGNYLLVAAYVARKSLGMGLENIARFNMDKLSHRQKYGKAQDLQFENWLKHPLKFE